jgi:hypothetical protein
MEINLATNPILYRACQRFFDAGYQRKPYPRPLNRIKVAQRPFLKEAYDDGLELVDHMNTTGVE